MADQHDYNRRLIAEFRATHGKSVEGRPLLLLTTMGAKSGQPRTTPLMYIRDAERLIIIASNAGAAAHPDWYHNLAAHPTVTIELGVDTFAARAAVLDGAARAQLWLRIVELHPFFADHQAKVTREIPLIVLEQEAGTAPAVPAYSA